MNQWVRKWFPLLALAGFSAALVWAISFEEPPPADFTFINSTEIKSVDPAIVTGTPESRIIYSIFEGLYNIDPKTSEPVPGVAKSYEISADQTQYTFHLRSNSLWTNGDAVTAEDFRWSWRRVLHPETASEYSYQLYYLKNGEKYNSGKVEPGDKVEIELNDRPNPQQMFPSGTILHGTLKQILEEPIYDDVEGSPVDKIYEVDINGQLQRFSTDSPKANRILNILLDFSEVGVRVEDDYTLVVTLANPTPYFLNLTTFYTLFPVHRASVELFGYPNWTKVKNLVTNGPYQMSERLIRDRIRLVKNRFYWDRDNVSLNIIDALAVNSETTGLNMYMNNEVDWVLTVPTSIVPELKKRDDFISAPMLTIYFYRINTTRPPLNNPKVRRALNLALDKSVITDRVLRSGQQPARSFVPPGLPGYQQGLCGAYNVAEAKKLLAEAGYPNGRGLPTIEIMYNTMEAHQTIAEVIQSEWKTNLGIDVRLANLEWQSYLATTRDMNYMVARAGWIGDYPDPNTFLDLFVSGGPQNQTGWKNEKYDRLISESAKEGDKQKRMEMLHQAEQILMDEMPIIPIYYYVSNNMVKPYVVGFYPNIQDLHPLHHVQINREARNRYLQSQGKP